MAFMRRRRVWHNCETYAYPARALQMPANNYYYDITLSIPSSPSDILRGENRRQVSHRQSKTREDTERALRCRSDSGRSSRARSSHAWWGSSI